MNRPGLGPSARENRGQWVRLRTLTLLRWLAVAGQVLALAVADRYLGLSFNVGLCYLVVGASVISNLLAVFLFPENKRLSETEAMLTLLFDIAQLAVLLYLTGGLNNPFALLMLAPVTISASVLSPRRTLFLGAMAVGLVTVLAFWSEPLRFADGSILAVPPLFAFGFWLAIITGVVFLAFYARRITQELDTMADALLAAQMALEREQKLTDLGGVVAAAAHELGTPLATIKLVSGELASELQDRPELYEDAQLIRQQADRCRDILRSMGRAGKDDRQLRQAPLEAVLREAAEPHADRGRAINFILRADPGVDPRQPVIRRRPEVIHGLRNLIQNAVDFADAHVWIAADWDARTIRVRIVDDGPGFDPQMLPRIGEPFARSRGALRPVKGRHGYEGMGLGLFIAKTLLERSGARLRFGNCDGPPQDLCAEITGASGRAGAFAVLIWPRARIEAEAGAVLGRNLPHET